MGKHARLSASQTKQWWKCPGSQAVLETRPDLRSASGYHAQMGTAAHHLAETCLDKGLEPEDFRDRIILIIEDANGDEGCSLLKPNAKAPGADKVWFEVDDEMIDAVTRFTDYVRQRIEDTGGELHLESYTIPLPDRDDTGGTADVTIDAWPDLLEVVDYKHGSGVFVPVEGNYQLRSYMLGKAHETDFSHDVYRYTIVQPRHKDAPFDGVMSEDISRDDLLAWAEELKQAAERVDEARKRVAEGCDIKQLYEAGLISIGEDGEHCTFCDIKTDCPAIAAKAQEMAMVDFDDEPEHPDPVGENRLAVLLPWVPLIDKWLRALEAQAKDRILAGGHVEGYKAVRNAGKRTFRETIEVDGEEVELTPELVAKIASEEFDLDEGDLFTEPELISGPKMEGLIKGKGSGERKKAFSNRLLLKQEGSLTIAPESDKRPAVDIDPGSDFDDDLEEEDEYDG